MECLSKSLRIVLLLFSFLIEVQATRTVLSPSSSPLSLERAPCLPDHKSDLLHFRHALISDDSSSVFCQLDIVWLNRSKMLSWIANSGCCLWDGVTCDPITEHVTRLELSCLPPNLTCYSSAGSSNSSEPSTLGLLNLPSPQEAERPSRSNELLQNLTKLRVLALDGLNQSGRKRLSNLPPSLEVLNLCLCKLHGALAENVFHLPKLTCLNLFGNKELSGYLPESTLKSSLKILDLSSSRFSGEVPESIGDLHSLQILWLNRCSFTGSIPSLHGNLTWLTHLEPSYNEFSGQVPPTLSNLDQLSLLDLSLKNFIRIPDVFDNKTQLLLDFSHNLFKGPIPPSTKNLSNLALLDISNNLIGGFILSSPFSLPSLTSLNLSNNGLSGHIGEFFAASALDHVDLSSNQLRGPVPSSILQLRNLTYLSISANNPIGVLDLQVLSRLESLTNLDLSDNILLLSKSENTEHVLPSLLSVSLSGCLVTEIPAFLRNSTSIEWIDLSRNRMHGDIPSWVWDIGAMSLSYLNLSHNFLASFEKVHRRNFVILDLHWNMIQGPVPPPSLPHSIIVFSLASNQLTGFIPGSICETKGLQVLNLSHNNFIATISQSLKNVSNSLLVLDMQENGLSGTISLTFNKDAALRSLHLNGNQFEGPLPCSLINRKQLEALDLGNNKLNYTFPELMGTLPSLQVLVLQSNGLCGPIGSLGTEFSFSRLRILDLSVDDFMGPLPGAFFANLKAMITTDQERSKWRHMDQGYYKDSMIATAKGCDMLIARILAILMTTDLSSNKFQGKFPDAIGEPHPFASQETF
ncbi:receptor-like protein 53 [Eucalyptus grandis]|uniref:receptor-like protein 53 n=1 Tax=Eucalyptus grandis TaxID=71139 RepID=UPI00192ED8EC|nr:receptor-like protein 53 [Eucalyptus grandis]